MVNRKIPSAALITRPGQGVREFATHHLPLEATPRGYDIFRDKAEGCITRSQQRSPRPVPPVRSRPSTWRSLRRGMPEHDHGASEILLIPLSGSAELRHDGQPHTLVPGMAAHIAARERVSLANPGSGPACLMVVASPPEFGARLENSPAA